MGIHVVYGTIPGAITSNGKNAPEKVINGIKNTQTPPPEASGVLNITAATKLRAFMKIEANSRVIRVPKINDHILAKMDEIRILLTPQYLLEIA